ncbi:PLP-dependent aminotransferase family protein (plasmid) [Klebsiella aerogenes]|uniref:aminotransferase-like domain-containing protein n=1 Tax=Klebsiella aerogenes TaxID=548 RepID=UPI00124EA295|nr:PLP-dependent aminotransferase family protein [Klebsiella aerogenes]QFI19811.1 PLP-dependent aminotransferase family protein [Klebsiella aerogenes]
MKAYIPVLVPNVDEISRVQQVVQTFLNAIKEKKFLPGDKLPSIRQCAKTFNLSTSTISSAFDILKDEGLIESERGSGYYLSAKILPGSASPPSRSRSVSQKNDFAKPIDDFWLLANVYQADDSEFYSVGCGWLPPSWYARKEIKAALRSTARQEYTNENCYGDPYGYKDLRSYIAENLIERSLSVTGDQILLTSGASRALDLISNTFLNTDDTVLVDEPGYCNFLSSMLSKRIKLVGVRWTKNGPDIKQLEKILAKENIKFYFTNPWLHNPTGASISLDVAHNLLNLAERYQITIVEDNVSGDLLTPGAISLSSLGGIERVIHIGSFSKTVSAGFRVGYIVATQNILSKLMKYKMLSGLTSSLISETITLNVIKQTEFRKYIKKLRGKLTQAQKEIALFFQEIGWEVFCIPSGGYYIYARPTGSTLDSRIISEKAKSVGLLFAPGYLFHPEHKASPWIRFNVAYCQEMKKYLYDFIMSEKTKSQISK